MLDVAATVPLADPGTVIDIVGTGGDRAHTINVSTLSALVVAGAAASRNDEHATALSRPGISWFAGVGICNGTAVLAMYAALARGPVILVAPLVATYPLITLLFTAILWRGEQTTLPRMVGVALTVLGVAALIGG